MSEPLLVVCGLSTDDLDALRSHGYEVEPANDGFRVIELAERLNPAGAIVDVSAPGPADPELIDRIRQAEPGCRVVFLVPEPVPERDAELIGSGADAILVGSHAIPFLVWTLSRVDRGGLVLDPDVARGLGEALTEGVTHRGEWSRQLAERARHAEELARAKQDFLGNVSHELRTPLTIIKGVAATLRMNEQDETQSQMLSQIEKATDNLVTMIESIITHASMQRGEYTVNVGSCDLAETIRNSAREAAEGHPTVNLEMAVPQRVPAMADPRAIHGIVGQLVDNACRYSDAGGVVSLKTRSGDEGVTVHVTDNGIGVDRYKIAAALAEAFSPGEDIMTKERAGLGLGLNLARNLVALHGGILWAEPLPGGGSRVAFTIPPVPPPSMDSGESSSLATASS